MDEELINRTTGQRIRTMRKILGISQSELGARINVTFQQIQKYEKGTNRMSIGTFMHICDVLDSNATQVLTEAAGKPNLKLLTDLALDIDSDERTSNKESSEKLKLLQYLTALDDPAIRASIVKLLEAVAHSKEKKVKA